MTPFVMASVTAKLSTDYCVACQQGCACVCLRRDSATVEGCECGAEGGFSLPRPGWQRSMQAGIPRREPTCDEAGIYLSIYSSCVCRRLLLCSPVSSRLSTELTYIATVYTDIPVWWAWGLS